MKKYHGKIIDAHHHLWDLNLNKHSWLIDDIEDNHLGDYSAIRNSYLVADFLKDSRKFPIEKSVHIQAGWDRSDPLGESSWLEYLSRTEHYPNAVVFYADLSDKHVESLLEKEALKKNIKGIRQILSWHENPVYNGCGKNYLLMDEWKKNFSLLKKYHLSFDMQIYPEQVDEVCILLHRYDKIPIVISHALMPIKRDPSYLSYWRNQLEKLSIFPNVSIKISGIAMFDHRWTVGSFKQIILPTVDIFSPARCMIGSNFPVDKLYGTYDKIMSAYIDILSVYSDQEQTDMFYNAANIFYGLENTKQKSPE